MAASNLSTQGGEGVLWSARELNAQFGDARLTQRFMLLTEQLAEHPQSPIPKACGEWKDTKAAYRFFDHAKVTPAKILDPHRKATIDRLQGHDVVLATQDTTVLNFTAHQETAGLGPIGGPEGLLGFFCHSCLAVSAQGVPLGLLGQKFWARPAERAGRETKPLEERESYRWIEMMEDAVGGIPDGVRVVMVADREAGFYELFSRGVSGGRDLLIRAQDKRLAGEMPYLSDALFAAPLLGRQTVLVPKKPRLPERQATLAIHAAPVTLRPPQGRGPGPALTGLWVYEESDPPAGTASIEWLLLTTLPVADLGDAARVVVWYSYRWRIERFHHVLKSGCQVEKLQLETERRLENALAAYSIVAWRLLHLTYAAREHPAQPCTSVLSNSEWKALYATIHKTTVVPDQPPDLSTATRWIARLGGFLGRRHDGEPGVRVLWRGIRTLVTITQTWELFRPPPTYG